jgi:hypothetical protein
MIYIWARTAPRRIPELESGKKQGPSKWEPFFKQNFILEKSQELKGWWEKLKTPSIS